jgi:hypothetical protein
VTKFSIAKGIRLVYVKTLIVFVLTALAAAAQNPTVKIVNTSRSGSNDFKVGDRFEVVVNGQANQPVSVRTTRQSQSDFGPVIGWTDSSGRWSTSRDFANGDFGPWEEAWTVGDQLANPVVGFSVGAPCIPGGSGQVFSFVSGPNIVMGCETATGMQTFATPSLDAPVRTPDSRLVSAETPEQTMGNLIETSGGASASGQHGDDAAVLITKVIGANVLSDREIRNVLSIIGAAFQNRNVVPPTVNPATTQLLQLLMAEAQMDGVKQEISKTVAFIQSQ